MNARTIESVGYITHHKEDIGKDYCSALRDALITAVADGLTNGTDSAGDRHE